MSELAAYYEAFRTGYWAEENETVCPCHGSGWALSEVDTWHECPVHFRGQPSPESHEGFESDEEYAVYYNDCMVKWAVDHKLAEYTREEAARLSYRAPVAAVVVPADDNDIPF